MNTARHGILAYPWIRGLHRSVTITQSLGLLGERGLSPDAYVRLYLARTLARRVLIEATGAFVNARDSGTDASAFPYQLADLFPKLRQLDGHDAPFNVLVGEACGGELMKDVEDWIGCAAMAHLVDWRTDGYMKVEIDARDRILPGGREATFWLFDRFSFTSTTEWHRGSAEWESAYAHDPAAVSSFVGVDRSLLRERPTSREMAVDAQTRRLVSNEIRDEAGRGLFLTDMVEQILARIQAGDVEGALLEAKRAHEIAPHLRVTANALAFCLVPSAPGDALNILDGLHSEVRTETLLTLANQVSACLACGDWPRAEEILGTMTDAGDEHAYLWEPRLLRTTSPGITYTSFDRWVNETQRLLSSRTGT